MHSLDPRLEPTSLERAFELARSGHFSNLEDIRVQLRREGLSSNQIFGPVLQRQLRNLINKANPGRSCRLERSSAGLGGVPLTRAKGDGRPHARSLATGVSSGLSRERNRSGLGS